MLQSKAETKIFQKSRSAIVNNFADLFQERCLSSNTIYLSIHSILDLHLFPSARLLKDYFAKHQIDLQPE